MSVRAARASLHLGPRTGDLVVTWEGDACGVGSLQMRRWVGLGNRRENVGTSGASFLVSALVSTTSRRALTAFVAAFLVLVVMSVGGEPAQAGTVSKPVVVSTTVLNGCTVFAWDMPFPGYTSGQSTTLRANSRLRIFCAAATPGTPVPVKVRVRGTSPIQFRMSNGASQLNYQLCWDAPCAVVIDKSPDRDVLADSVAFDVPFYGEVFPNQTVPAGPYTQTVTVRVTY